MRSFQEILFRLRQVRAKLLQEVPLVRCLFGSGVRIDGFALRRSAARYLPAPPALSPKALGLVEELVAGQGDEQVEQFLGIFQLELAGDCPGEEAGPDELHDVHGVQQPAKVWLG